MDKLQSWFLHIDLDAFFASVEQLDHPEYRGKPVIVGGKPEDKRSVVSTASYEARKFGVHSAMPTSQAYKLCPQGIFVHGRMERYSNLSFYIMEIIKNYSPDFMQMSIDEAFIDITGTEKLFGTPIQIAEKIKEEIKDKTGLTVSIGIATTKYIAKIASDINKPNGMYYVEKGKEEEFMLNLPLKKVFGLGNKTLETLNKSGIFTTKELHEKSKDSIQFICGKNTGDFLYNAIRGKIQDNFEKKSKTHSISSETTFIQDLTNNYTIETMILEICHSIMFRMLRENGFSKTLMVKIRYEDFTTVTIQETYDKNILTLDSLFSKAKNLFEKKWEKNRGIRLIGIALENIENEEKPYQQELFGDGNEKKQKVEKAILNLEKKHPEIKIHKARMLENLNKTIKSILLLILLTLYNIHSIQAVENHSIQKGAAVILPETEEKIEKTEKGKKLFNWEIKGYWKGTFDNGFKMTFANNNPFASSFNIPIFKQEIDLSASFLINNQWKLQMEFMENYNKNTISINYKGDNYLQDFIFSNRGITFPDYYSIKNTNYFPGGGTNEAPGILFHFVDYKNNKFLGDILFRYDMTQKKNATFYGKKSVNDTIINLSDFNYGKIFIIPDENIISQIKDVYVENICGEFSDANGKKYNKISKSNYTISIKEKTITLSRQCNSEKDKNKIPTVLITFEKENQTDELISKIGNYNQEDTYLGQIQTLFSKNNSSIKLTDYSYSLKTQIENSNALVIQSPYGFSPFLFCARYDLGLLNEAQVDIIISNTEVISEKYIAKNPQKDTTFLLTDYFLENHFYTEAVNILNKNDLDYTQALTRYPFADTNPYIYLTKQTKSSEVLRLRSFSKISNYDIGKNASYGSVKLYVNGIEDKAAQYSSTSGFVTPSINISETDKIYISWEEEADSFSNGAFIGGLGFLYNLTDSTKIDISFSTRIPFSPFIKYSTKDNQFSSYAALNAGIKYEKNNLKLSDSFSIAVENDNLKNSFLINNINANKKQVYYLSQTSGKNTNCIPSLNFLNAPELKQKNCGTIKNYTGMKEENITGYVIPLSWDFSNVTNNETAWASIDINLNNNTTIANSSIYEIAIKNTQKFNNNDYELYLQLGIKADENFSGEDYTTIPTWKISNSALEIQNDKSVLSYFDFNETGWQFIKIKIPDEQRAKLISYNDARIIIVKKNFNYFDDQNIGELFIGPFEPHEQNSIISSNNGIFTTNSTQQNNNSNLSKKYFETEYYADIITWQNNDENLKNQELIIESKKYFPEINFNHYKNISFDFSYEILSQKENSNTSEDTLELLLCQAGSEAIPSLKLTITAACLKNYTDFKENWHNVKIDLDNGDLWIDENLISKNLYTLIINKTISTSEQIIKINTGIDSKIITQGNFLYTNVYLENTENNFIAKNYTEIKYKTDSIIIGNENNIILKAPEINIISNQVFSNFENSISTQVQAKAQSYNFEYGIDSIFYYSTNTTQNDIFTNGGHFINTKEPLFSVININENYRYTKDSLIQTSNFIQIDLSKISIPFNFNLFFESQNTYIQESQNINSNLDFTIPFSSLNIQSKTIFTANQKSNIKKAEEVSILNYFDGILISKKIEFSPGFEKYTQRNSKIKSELILNFVKLNFAPQIQFELSNTLLNVNNCKKETNYTINYIIPFSNNNNNFALNISRISGYTQNNFNSTSYYNDFTDSFTNIKNNNLIFTELPIYDLFDTKLSNKLSTNYQNSFYSTKYEFTWKHNLFNNIKDLIIPKTISFGTTRDIRKTEVFNDIYQIKYTQIKSFINLFGKDGKYKKLNFYNQDEFTSSFTTSLKLPLGTNTNTEYLFSYYLNYLMYMNQNNYIKNGIEFTISNNQNWKTRATVLWLHEGKKSLLIYLPKLFIKNIQSKEQKILRKEIANVSFGNSNNEFSSSYELTHYEELTIEKNYSLNTSFGVTFKQFETKANSIEFNLKIGAKLIF